MRLGVAALRQRLERDRARLLLRRAPVPARLRAGRRGAPVRAAGPLRDWPSTSASSCATPPSRARTSAASRSARAGCSGRATTSATSGRRCATPRPSQRARWSLHRRLRPRRRAAPGRRVRPARPRGLLHRRSPTTPAARPLGELVRRHHGDALESASRSSAPTRPGSRPPRRVRLLGWRAARAPGATTSTTDGRLLPDVRERLERGDTGVQRGRAAGTLG